MALGHGPTIVRDGLVLHLDAANPKSYPGTGTTWSDLSGNGNHGTLVNGVGYSSDNKGTLVFDGADDLFSAPIQCNKTYYSLEWWFNPSSVTNYNHYMYMMDPNNTSYGAGSVGWGNWVFHTTSNGAIYVGTDIATRISNTNPGSVVPNEWQCFCWTFDNGFAKIYKNATLLNQKSMNITQSSSFSTIATRETASTSVAGNKSSLKVYSEKVLTADEVAQNFNAMRGRYGL